MTKKKPLTLKSVTALLLEEPSGAPINPMEPSPLPLEVQNLSLDLKVDSYLMKYEKESLPTQKSYEVPGTDLGISMETAFATTFKKLLEAEGDDPAAGGDDLGGGGDAPTGDLGGGDDAPEGGGDAPEEPPHVPNPRFNVSNFAQSVARLVMNYDGLLDPKTTILNRAKAYITKNYDGGVAEQMMELLDRQFGLKPKEGMESDGPVAPPAAGAWTGVGGGGGA